MVGKQQPESVYARPNNEIRRTFDAAALAACATAKQETVFAAPSRGAIIASFGRPIAGAKGEGLRFAVKPGDPVRASADGVIAFAGFWSPIGDMIVIDHGDGLHSLYWGPISFEVDTGNTVTGGQTIAHATVPSDNQEPVMSFEIRRNGVALDPTKLLAGL